MKTNCRITALPKWFHFLSFGETFFTASIGVATEKEGACVFLSVSVCKVPC